MLSRAELLSPSPPAMPAPLLEESRFQSGSAFQSQGPVLRLLGSAFQSGPLFPSELALLGSGPMFQWGSPFPLAYQLGERRFPSARQEFPPEPGSRGLACRF